MTKFRRRIRCASCGQMIFVNNFNRKLCIRCGYRGKDTENEQDT